MTATSQADSEESYRHWPDDESLLRQPPSMAPGYDSHNGLRSYDYTAPSQKPASPAAPKVQPYPQPQVIYFYPQAQQMAYYPTQQYTYQQSGMMAYPAPAYYGYAPKQAMPMPMQAQPVPATYVYKPAYSAPKPKEWKGRTKAEVDEDNMKIAAKEGAYDKRKVVPVGMKDDQMMWCVETDGSHTLR